jgi:hypothetical protein
MNNKRKQMLMLTVNFQMLKTLTDLQDFMIDNASDSMTLLHDFQTNVSQQAGTISYDTDIFYSGNRSLKMVTTTDTNIATARIDFGSAIDLSGSYFTIMGRRTNDSSLSKIEVLLWGASFENRGMWGKSYGGAIRKMVDDWELITITNGGVNPLTETVRYIDIRITNAVSGTANTVYFNQFNKVTSPVNGSVIFTLDGAYETQFSLLKPLLDAKGYKACSMISQQTLLGTGNYATLAQLHTAEDDGWDITTHSGVNVADLSESELVALARTKQKWLKDNGFNWREGGRFICTLQNLWDELAVDVLGRYFTFLRTGSGSSITTLSESVSLPLFNPRSITDVASNATYAQQETILTKVATHKQLCVLTWHEPNREGEMTIEEMSTLIDLIATLELNVITFSDLYTLVGLT